MDMHLFRAARTGVGRRLLRPPLLVAGDALPVQARQVGTCPPARHIQPSQYRQYTLQRAPSLVRKTAVRKVKVDDLLFSQKDVPVLGFWEQRVSAMAPEDVTGEDCFNAATHYCAIATNGLSTWKGRLAQEYGIDIYTLHYTALSLLGDEPGPSWRLGLHMLRTASDLGYDPSTLTLIGLLTKTRDDSSASAQFREVMPRFDKLVRSGRNPDALTLQGILLRRQQRDNQALVQFDRAIKATASIDTTNVPAGQRQSPAQTVAAELVETALANANAPPDTTSVSVADNGTVIRPPKWNWEAPCHLERGRILLQEGRRKEAEAAFRIAAVELDQAEAYLELARILPEGLQDREEYLVRAAISLDPKACLMLADEELKKARRAANLSDSGKSDDHRTRATEWFHLAGSADKAEKVRSGLEAPV